MVSFRQKVLIVWQWLLRLIRPMPCFVHDCIQKLVPHANTKTPLVWTRLRMILLFVQYTWMTGEKIHSLGEIMHNIEHYPCKHWCPHRPILEPLVSRWRVREIMLVACAAFLACFWFPNSWMAGILILGNRSYKFCDLNSRNSGEITVSRLRSVIR